MFQARRLQSTKKCWFIFQAAWFGSANNIFATPSFEHGVDGFDVFYQLPADSRINNIFVSTNDMNYYLGFLHDLYSSDEHSYAANWRGLINSTICIVRAIAEIATGTVAEVLTGGGATPAAALLFYDGISQMALHTGRLVAYANHGNKTGDAIPSNICGVAGKIIYMSNGVLLKMLELAK